MMRWLVTRSTFQYGLVTALLAVLAYGLLAPGGDARAMAVVATATLGTPGVGGTPAPTRPIMPTSTATATASRTPGRSLPVASSGSPVAATPQAASPTSAALPASPGTAVPTPAVTPSITPATATMPIPTPTPVPSAALGTTIVSDLSPLSFTLNGQNQVAPSTMVIGVSDASAPAQQAGWHLTLTMEQFRVAGAPSRALPRNAVSLVGASVACARGATCTAPQNSLAYPIEIPSGELVTIYEAAPGTGGGQFVVTLTFAIRVPATAYAGSYSTTIVPGIVATTPPRATPAASPSPVPSLAPPAVTATAAATTSVPSSTPLAPTATAAVTPPPPSLAPSKTATVAVPAPTPAPSTPMPPTATATEVAPAPVPPSPAPFAATDRIGTSLAVNLRTGPSASYPTQGLLPSGTLLLATGETRMVAGGLWRQFALADGRTGWVRDLDVLSVSR